MDCNGTDGWSRKRYHAEVPHCRSKRICLDSSISKDTMKTTSRKRDDTQEIKCLAGDPKPAVMLHDMLRKSDLPTTCKLDSGKQQRCRSGSHSSAADAAALVDVLRGQRSPAPSPEASWTIFPTPVSVGSLASSSKNSDLQKETFSPSSVSSKSTAPTSICSHDCDSPISQRTRLAKKQEMAIKRKRSDNDPDVPPEWAPLQLKGITPEELRWSLATGKRVKLDTPGHAEHPKFSDLRLPREQPKSCFARGH